MIGQVIDAARITVLDVEIAACGEMRLMSVRR